MSGRRRSRRRARGQQRWVVPAALGLLAMGIFAGWLALGLRGEAGEGPAGTPTAAPIPSTELGIETVTPVVDERTPTVEESAASSPEAPSTPQTTPTPAAPLVIGQFGELPPPNMPQTRPDLARLQPHYTLALSLDLVPKEAPVYRAVPKTWDADRVRTIALALGIESEVTQSGDAFHVADSEQELYVAGDLIQYQRLATAQPGGELPEDALLIQTARDWLTSHQLVGEGLGEGTVTDRLEEAGLAIVVFQPAEPSPILAAVPRATVTVTADGAIQQAFINWPAAFESSIYSLRDAASLWQDVLRGRGYLEVAVEGMPPGTEPLPASVTVTGVEIVYTDAGNPGNRYLTPLVRFTGEATITGIDGTVPVRVSVPAVAAQAAPRG